MPNAFADSLRAVPYEDDAFALSLNENPFSPLPAVRAAIIDTVGLANRYPEFLPERLRELIADRVGVTTQQVVVGAGATGVVMQTLQAVTNPGDRIVLASPTFDGYPIVAGMARLRPIVVPLNEQGGHDLESMADAAADARVVVLCRPHNPTGTLESADDVELFVSRVPSDTVVVLDEAYIEFVSAGHRIDVSELIARFPNVVVVRTFSKAYGLAGMRTGYGISAPELARTLWAMQLPFGTSAISLAAVTASYEAEGQLQQRIRLITAERAYLRMRLRGLGVKSTASHANFVYLPSAGTPWSHVFDGTGLRVRSYADGAVRITVGNRRSTRAVVAAVKENI
jgi:histidinol-phosphate aminotransferase